MPKKIIIVRHGETEWNVTRRLQGWSDIPLNKTGREQAKKVAQRLSQEVVDVIYASDHKRALTTARHIAKKLGLKPFKRTALREDRMGVFEGWKWESERDPYKQKLWASRDLAHARGDLDWKPDGGESLREHTARVKKFIDEFTLQHPDSTVLLVSHGGTINRIMEIFGFKNVTDEYVRYRNTSVTVIVKEDDKYVLSLHNDSTHLN